MLVGLSSVILAGLIGALNKNRASGVHDVNPRPQPHQTYCSTPAPRSQSPLPSPNFNNALLVSLSKRPSVLQRISDPLPSDIPDDPYTSLKTQLLARFSTPSKQCLSTLLDECNRGTLTVCEFLQKLRSTLSSHYDPSSKLHEDLLRPSHSKFSSPVV